MKLNMTAEVWLTLISRAFIYNKVEHECDCSFMIWKLVCGVTKTSLRLLRKYAYNMRVFKHFPNEDCIVNKFLTGCVLFKFKWSFLNLIARETCESFYNFLKMWGKALSFSRLFVLFLRSLILLSKWSNWRTLRLQRSAWFQSCKRITS